MPEEESKDTWTNNAANRHAVLVARDGTRIQVQLNPDTDTITIWTDGTRDISVITDIIPTEVMARLEPRSKS